MVDKTLQRRDFRAAGPAHAPGLFEHTTAALACAVQALGDVVVAARGEEAWVGLIRSTVENQRLFDGLTHVFRQIQFEQGSVITGDDQQIGTAVDLFPLPVLRQVLLAAVAEEVIADKSSGPHCG